MEVPVKTVPLLLLLALAIPSGARAEGKSQYNLFHPVPREAMREFDTDRPDRVEAPYTVDAGHFQIETELFGYAKDTANEGGVEVKRRTTSINTMNIKAGLLSNLELQAIFPSFGRTTTTAGTEREVRQGSGDLQLRLKYNFLGNDEGQVAMAVLPWVKAPTARAEISNGKWEGGVILPLFLHLPHEIDLETMVEIAREKDEAGSGFHNVFETGLSLEHRFLGQFGAFAEIFGEASSEQGKAFQATFDTGLVYTLGENMQFDAGVYVGLTESAEDLRPFVGWSYRI